MTGRVIAQVRGTHVLIHQIMSRETAASLCGSDYTHLVKYKYSGTHKAKVASSGFVLVIFVLMLEYLVKMFLILIHYAVASTYKLYIY